MVVATWTYEQIFTQFRDGAYKIAFGAFAPKAFRSLFLFCCAGKDTFFYTLEPGRLRFFTLSIFSGEVRVKVLFSCHS